MGIKTYRPYTPSRRHMTGSDFSEITKTTPEKSLVVSLSKTAGRNNQGKITVRHRGGGVKRKYRVIDFKRKKDGIPATVIGIEYDPNRSANIALICYADGEKAYIIAPEGLTDGMKVMNGPEAEVRVGNCLPLSAIPVGTQVHNIELHPGKGRKDRSRDVQKHRRTEAIQRYLLQHFQPVQMQVFLHLLLFSVLLKFHVQIRSGVLLPGLLRSRGHQFLLEDKSPDLRYKKEIIWMQE